LATPQTGNCRFDPTAGSLHIGHLERCCCSRDFKTQDITLIGGTTALIGDRIFKASECRLNSMYDFRLQIGGNDQRGNILSGIDYNRHRNGREVHGLTLPLITKSDGTNFN
jgi:tyrosyl-tRNA synthetase